MSTVVGMNTHADTAVHSLDPSECWKLLRKLDTGRLAVIADGAPDIFPVNYVVDGGTVVFRTAPGTKASAIASGAPVAFEVDGYDSMVKQGWSVVLKGTAARIKNIDELIETAYLPLYPLNSAPKGIFVRISPQTITGRRFAAAEKSDWQNVLRDQQSGSAT